MTENDNKQIPQQSSRKNPDFKSLEKLIGTWKTSGGVQGEITFERMEGGFFLVQHVDLERDGHKIRGIEIIGQDQTNEAETGAEFKSRFYNFLDGTTLNYVYEPEDDNTFTLWMEEKGSSGYMKGKISEDGNAFRGEWIYPGGGYKATGTKVVRK